MKRLLKIFLLLLTLLLALLLLYGCAQNSAEQSESVPESESQPESSAPESSENSSDESKPDDEYLGTIFYINSYIDIYKKAVETNETRLVMVDNGAGTLSTIAEVPATEYWIVDKIGNLLIDQPFYDLNFYPEIASYNDPPTDGIFGCYKGNYYDYGFIDGKFELISFTKAGVVDTGGRIEYPDYPYYEPTEYWYDKFNVGHGISDKDGNVIFEPIFAYFISIPFEDRFIGTINTTDRGDFTEGYSLLMDKDKNIFAAYTSISFHVFDDGSYIGLAGYSGYGYNWGKVLRDKNGKVLKVGERFIDKDGNEISPCFNGVTGFWDITSPSDIITAVDENGSTIEIKASDYICKP